MDINMDFQQNAGSITPGYYSYKKSGTYCAGSYHLYNQFRNSLSRLANHRYYFRFPAKKLKWKSPFFTDRQNGYSNEQRKKGITNGNND